METVYINSERKELNRRNLITSYITWLTNKEIKKLLQEYTHTEIRNMYVKKNQQIQIHF